mmetsp:Transcript_87732/g.200499  ORF Transcript_87732/g.200499 Transcript_87732/m.200499 type:complete len:256 (+) Transcript_87732:437-1204(+)
MFVGAISILVHHGGNQRVTGLGCSEGRQNWYVPAHHREIDLSSNFHQQHRHLQLPPSRRRVQSAKPISHGQVQLCLRLHEHLHRHHVPRSRGQVQGRGPRLRVCAVGVPPVFQSQLQPGDIPISRCCVDIHRPQHVHHVVLASLLRSVNRRFPLVVGHRQARTAGHQRPHQRRPPRARRLHQRSRPVRGRLGVHISPSQDQSIHNLRGGAHADSQVQQGDRCAVDHAQLVHADVGQTQEQLQDLQALGLHSKMQR